MERVREQLLELTRCSLWGTEPSNSLFGKDTSWQLLFKNAQKQAILGPIYTQVESLEVKPPKATMLHLHSLTTLNRKMYLRQLQVLDTVTKRLQEGGIARPVLMKGVGISSNYLDPGTRQCGDIDLYVGREHYMKAYEMISSWSEALLESGAMNNKHFHFLFDGIPIEIHRIVTSNNNISRNRSQFTAWCVNNMEGEELREEQIEGVEVYLPPYNFDAIYIFYHAWNHFCSYGIAFRQICDWSRYLVKYQDKIDYELLAKDLDRFGLIRPWGFFASVATTMLGLDKSVVDPFDDSKDWKTEIVAERIWRGGNFGFYGDLTSTGQGVSTFKRKFNNFFALFRSFKFLYSIDRSYAINFLLHTPLNSIKSNIASLYHTLSGK